jgi:hypothetical protein
MAPQPQIYFGKSIDEESNGIFFDFPFRVMVLWSSGPTHCSVPPVFRLLAVWGVLAWCFIIIQ